MQEEIDIYFESSKESMDSSLDRLKRELKKIRTGKASPSMLESINVDYYGSQTPLQQVANVGIADGRTLTIKPWEKGMLEAIERSIFEANLGVTPQNDGEIIRIMIPPLTEERRKELVKQVKKSAEEAKISLRSSRRDLIEEIKKAVKDGYPEDLGKDAETNADNLTKKYTTEIDSIVDSKEKDIMKV